MPRFARSKNRASRFSPDSAKQVVGARRHLGLVILVGLLGLGWEPSPAMAGLVYWATGSGGEIRRANLDGSTTRKVLGSEFPRGIALDLTNGKIYWTDDEANEIRRANLNGTGVETLLEVLDGGLAGIALDLESNRMYWADYVHDKIRRANLDGSGVEDLVDQGLVRPEGIALDLTAQRMYWADRRGLVAGDGSIKRAGLNGSNVEEVVQNVDPLHVALDLGSGFLYWTHRSEGAGPPAIQRSDLDGLDVTTLLTGPEGLGVAGGIALDVAGGKMYWGDFFNDLIKRASLQGANVEVLVPSAGAAGAVALNLLCGNGVVDPAEECDDGNNLDGDECPSDCVPPPELPSISFTGLVVLGLALLWVGYWLLAGRPSRAREPGLAAGESITAENAGGGA